MGRDGRGHPGDRLIMRTLMQPILQPMQEFGPCLKGILEKKKISASELARMMAYKSRNSIFRILDGEGGHGARQAFFERLTAEDPLSLSEMERAQLAQALEISRVGPSVFLSNRAMRELLMNANMEPAQQRVRIEAADDPQDPDFKKALERMARGKKAYLTITGCCDRAIFDALRRQIMERDVACEVRITHFIYTGAEEIVRNISAIQPLLYCDFYSARCVESDVFSKERESLYRCNCIYVHAQDEYGAWYDQQFILVDKGVFVPLRCLAGVEHDPFEKFFERDIQRTPPLKAAFAHSGELEGYLDYTENCRKLEHNRAVYTIKLDVPVSFIHSDILLPCARDGFHAIGIREGEALETALAGLERIHRQRFENFFAKHKTNHTIFSRKAMERFARTGRQSDHFFALRAYTREERAAILSHLREQEAENPYFHIHFFREEFELPLTEVGLYEGAGTLLAKPYTNYDLSDHAETIIAQEEFCARYKEFFIKDLLEKHVLSHEETLDTLDQLIEIAKKA